MIREDDCIGKKGFMRSAFRIGQIHGDTWMWDGISALAFTGYRFPLTLCVDHGFLK